MKPMAGDPSVGVMVKYKFCCGNIDNKRKAARMKILFAQHFNSLIHSAKESKLAVLASKIKSLFKFGSK
jgi:hypothetical protein